MFLGRINSIHLVPLIIAGGQLASQASTICLKATDYADLALPRARASVVNLSTQKASSALTDRDGKACVSGLPEGLYSVEVGMEGFLNVRYYPVRLAYPTTPELQFRLPFGEITEGGLAVEAIISGTLKRGDEIVRNAKICLQAAEGDVPSRCTVTNELGEYALYAPPGAYRVQVVMEAQDKWHTTINVPAPGVYRNRITVSR